MKNNITPELEKILYHVEKPGRYVGGEHNQIVKPWESVETHVVLVFPDIYDLGQPNLGLAILYDILNEQKNILAERAFTPWVDMEAELRTHAMPLFSLESKTPLNKFDIVGFTLPYESIYTNVLNTLDLSGIPLLAKNRTNADPLVVAGGQACYNPEPMADFIDAFVIGEGEEVILEITDCYQGWQRTSKNRQTLLRELAEIDGVYVPAFFEFTYNPDGTIAGFGPTETGLQPTTRKRIVAKMPPPPSRFLVPNIETVHDRISIEIMRGCTRGCRFCHAGMVNRPVRERSVSQITEAVAKGINSTGYEEVGLLSLSSSDHSHILEIVRSIYENFHGQKVSVSLPSLRIASFSVDLMDELKELQPAGGFTIAPEAATDRMRAIINKQLDESVLFETVKTVFEHGWLNLKLYFMIGLPGETLEDVQAILDLSRKIQLIGKQIRGNRVRISIGVSTFIPKPHTPFQWYPVDSIGNINQKINLLRDGTRKFGMKLTYSLPETTYLEAWLSRGDRRLGQVIIRAWQKGAKFDAWGERCNLSGWKEAFTETGLDPAFYTQREKSVTEILPWDHISTGVKKDFLLRELNLSKQGRTREDCRNNCTYCGISDAFSDLNPVDTEFAWRCPA